MKNLLFLLILTIAPLFSSPSFARIDIVPQKIVIESRERGSEFTVLNLFNKPGTFRIELLNYKQNNKGIYTELKEPLNPDFDPNEIVRFSPRQFSLEPNGRQKVRLSLRKSANLPEGEYRFHVKALRFATDDERKKAGENSNSRVQMLMNTGIVIPVVVRHGKTEGAAKLENANLVAPSETERNRPELRVDVLRSGNQSAIGKLEVFWSSNKATPKKIGTIKNANVFTEIDKRQFTIPLSEYPQGAGSVIIRYRDGVDEGKILDEIILQR